MTNQSADTNARDPRQVARKIMIDLTIMTAIGVILALIGPFGSFAEPLGYRLVSWVGFSWIGYALFAPMGPVVDRVSNGLDLPRAPIWVVAAAISSLPMTAIVHVMGYLPGPVPIPRADQFFATYPYVFVIGGGVTALFYLLASKPDSSMPPAAAIPPAPPPATHPMASTAAPPLAAAQPLPQPQPQSQPQPDLRPEAPSTAPLVSNPLFDALPAELGSDVIALEMEDHYVRVHTALGSELVLMRLRDAMAHVADIEGRQTHRSWWVARGAVEDVRREGRNVRLVLARGIEAPVSRAQVSELRDAGWI